jgi:hypothetical protein
LMSELRLTPDGQSLRDKIEHDTDQFFFAPWKCLSNSNRQDLDRILNRLWKGLSSV